MDKKRNEKKLEAEQQRLEELNWSYQLINDYPLSDKTLVVNPQSIPLSFDESSPVITKDI